MLTGFKAPEPTMTNQPERSRWYQSFQQSLKVSRSGLRIFPVPMQACVEMPPSQFLCTLSRHQLQ